MLTKHCPRCGQNKGINYYYKIDGKGWHTVCSECRDALFKNQPPSIILYNSNDKY
jgi:NADH pyrophosphatase NudC (nudix superfamily)